MMRLATLTLLISLFSTEFSLLHAQIITGTGCAGTTEYTDGTPNDSIYYYPAGQTGSLSASATVGLPGWTFKWSSYNSGTNQWTQIFVENNVSQSTISNLNPGLYSVTINDGTGAVVGCDYAWISQIIQEPSVDVLPIAPACTGPINLQGVITPAIVTPHSNLPNNPMFVNSSTQITVCFSGTHTWVSDLAFYLRGPASCGSPNVLLSPNPGAIGQGSICNSGNNISNLCFTTQPASNINICSASTPLSGTYSSYGPSFTPINWSTIYGCEATASGWAVQIYDCIGGDVGSLTGASIVFNGVDACGDPQTVSYATPGGFSSFIADNSCSTTSASIFVVPPVPSPPPIACTYGYEWTSDPPVYIPNATSSLNISIPQLEYPQGTPIAWQDVEFTLSITSNCDSLGYSDEGGEGCLGGNSSDTELFDFLPTSTAFIDPVPDLCEFNPAVQLTANVPGGFWIGPGVSPTGLFDPALSGIGSFNITYLTGNPCIPDANTVVNVIQAPQPVIDYVAPICVDADPITLTSNQLIGVSWSGPGIVDPASGIFDPAAAGAGTHLITLDVTGYCPATGSTTILVNALPNVIVTPSQTVCSNATTQLSSAGAVTYSWSPATYLSNPNISNPSASASSDITYTVTGTDINNCSATAQTTLTMVALPTVTAQSVAAICPGTSITLSATSNGNGNFSWSPSAGVQNSNTASATATPLVSTTYTVTYTDGCNLQATTQVPVEVDVPLIVNAGADTQFCTGSSVILTGSVQGQAAQTQWISVSGSLPESNDPPNNQYEVNVAGVYQFHAFSPLGCDYSDAINVIEVQLPVMNLPQQVDLCPMSTVSITAGNNWDAVSWETGSTADTIVVSQPGYYGVTVTEQNCSSTDSIFVNLVILPQFDLGPDVDLCTGQSLTFDIGTTGTWNTGATASSINVTDGGKYQVIVNVGPCSVVDSVKVTLLPLPVVYLGPDVLACFDQDVILSAFDPANNEYIWNTGEITSEISVIEEGQYSVIASNTCGEAEDVIMVNFEDCTFRLFFPNAFTPDNDGINDVWEFKTYNLKKFRIQIFNRWGDPVFETDNPNGVWTGDVHDGTHYGNTGIYFFRATYETNKGEAGERSGHIVMIR